MLHRTLHLVLAATAAATTFSARHTASAQDWIIPAGTTVVHDTTATNRPLFFSSVVIESNARLVVIGANPFSLVCAELRIEGELDLSGRSSDGVVTLNTTNQPEEGAPGGPGGGAGGTGSAEQHASTPMGLPGLAFMAMGLGGLGGETGYALGPIDRRRGAGGGGGRLAADQPQHPSPLDPANHGFVATPGFSGNPLGLGAVSQSLPAAGGAAGAPFFVDGDATNDFWGRRATPSGVQSGEVGRPTGGRGGGAGGDASATATFPAPFTPSGDEKGAGGGGGGGLGLVHARRITLGAGGRILANGGDGGHGEHNLFFNAVGGGSGAGSGGWLVLQALDFDLTLAGVDALSALGGRGGAGRNMAPDVEGAGGNGGPGVIQLHTPDGTAAAIRLPAGRSLDDLTAPHAHVLLPILR